ncbi:MAG: hypothetical protein ACKVU4_05290 [Phycisphaerales bacterium]
MTLIARSTTIVSSVVASLCGAGVADAQCQPQWLVQPQGTALNGYVRAVGTYQGQLVIGGAFTQASGRTANRVARWDGPEWAALGEGVNGPVRTVQEFNGDLYVGGEFSTAGGQPAPGIARWNGVAWSNLGTLSPVTVFDLVVFENQLVVTTGGVARWNGASWAGFGSGTGFLAVTLAVHDDYLYAGGFKLVGGFEAIARVARWDGQSWFDLPPVPPGGPGHTVTKLGVHGGALYAGGSNTAVSVHGWNGASWYPIGSGLLWFNVYGIASYGGELIAGGDAPLGGQGLARWNGSAWTNLGLGLNGTVHAMTVHEGALIAGGAFTAAGGLPSPYWARYGCPCQPDCNNSGSLTIADFRCFQNAFVTQDPYADCNASGTLTVADFGCFQGNYVLGCP